MEKTLMSIFKRNKKSKKEIFQEQRKEDIFKAILSEMEQKTPSEYFASGAIFDITRTQHDTFEKIVRSGDIGKVHDYFIRAYLYFCQNPEMVGFTSRMVNVDNDDTDFRMWNTEVFELKTGDFVTLCYIPVESDTEAARMFGFVVSDDGDGYYWSMLDKDKEVPARIFRNQGLAGIADIGEVKGRGIELRNSFLDSILNDFYRKQ